MSEHAWIREMFAKLDQGDIAGWASYLADDVFFRVGNGDPVTGPAAATQRMSGFFTVAKDLRHDLLDIWNHPGGYTLRAEVVLTRKKDGKTLTLPFVDLLDVRDRKIVRYLSYVDPSPIFA